MSYSPAELRRHHLPAARRALRRSLPLLVRDYAWAFRYGARELTARLRQGQPAPGDGPDVLVLTGIWEPYAFIYPLVDHLRASGFRTHAIKRPSLNLDDLEVLADRVADFMDEEGLTDTVVVAHSKGGLVAKQLMVSERTKDRVSGAVAICTPFGGSDLAGLLPDGVGVRSLLPGSPMLRELAAHTEVNPRIVSIYPEYDPVVPDGGNHLEGAHNVEIAEFGHFTLLNEDDVLEAVAQAVAWLEEHPDGEPPDFVPDVDSASSEDEHRPPEPSEGGASD